MAAFDAAAHTSSSASLRRIESQDPSAEVFEWQVSWRDLDALLDLDADQDGALTWAEARMAEGRLVALAQRSFEWRAKEKPCVMDWRLAGSARRGDAGHALFEGRARCEAAASVSDADYHFLERVDPTHRLLVARGAGGPTVVEPGGRIVWLSDTQDAAGTRTAPGVDSAAEVRFSPWDFLREGALHILRGPDHVAFVLTLVLPVALLFSGPGRQLAMRRLLVVVTAFTLAHSITLALASLHVWSPPAAIVEPAIAASIAVAALHNLVSRGTRGRVDVAIAFGFGLLHGFGFAEVLAPLELPAGQLALGLGLFNLGVEIGQLVIVGLALTSLAVLARSPHAPRRAHFAGSVGFALLGGLWFVQRAL